MLIDNSYPITLIDTVHTYRVSNVRTIDTTYNVTTYPASDDETSTVSIYFVIDIYESEGAFAHWFYESAVFLHDFIVLKQHFPFIKIVLKTRRTYKLYIPHSFGIMDTDIIFTDILPNNNICYLPVHVTSLNISSIDATFTQLVHRLIDFLMGAKVKKDIDILLLPRQSENYRPNDRITDTTDIERHIQQLPSVKVLHTDNITNILEQIHYIKRSKTIILTDGSPYLVNGVFASDSTIILLGDITYQQGGYMRLNYITTLIETNNKVVRVPYTKRGNYSHSIFLFEDLDL